MKDVYTRSVSGMDKLVCSFKIDDGYCWVGDRKFVCNMDISAIQKGDLVELCVDDNLGGLGTRLWW